MEAEMQHEEKRTENGGLATDAGAADLELFYNGMLRGATAEATAALVSAAWDESPARAVALVFQARDVRKGKGEKRAPMDAFMWLRREHPNVYAQNLETFSCELGCYKDLLVLASEAAAEGLPPLGARGELVELEVMADALARDRETLKAWKSRGGRVKGNPAPTLSLAAKWAPSSKGHFDRAERGDLVRRLACLVVGGRTPTVRADYRRVLSALRAHLGLVERLMSAKRFDEISYEGVPSRALKRYRAAFAKRDADRFGEFLAAARSKDPSKAAVRVKHEAVHPHELVEHYLNGGDFDEAIEAQWEAALEAHTRSVGEGGGGALRNAVPVVDVSGSMSGTPMAAAIALGLFMAGSASGPMRGRVLTFSASPRWHEVAGETLHEQVMDLRRMKWGMNTDLAKVFRLIAQTGTRAEVPAADMPSTLWVLTDGQFDQMCTSCDRTALDEARRQFSLAGYEAPDLCFWNLRAPVSRSTGAPASAHDTGVAMLSGFSPSAFKTVATRGVTTPAETLEATLEPYLAMVRGL